jgi:hypothetical protein
MPYVPDSPPAKLWELLRRNTEFAAVLRRLKVLDAAVRSNSQPIAVEIEGAFPGGVASLSETVMADVRNGNFAFARGLELLNAIDRTNPLVGGVLRWLVPQPVFTARRPGPQIRDLAQPNAWGPTIVGIAARREWKSYFGAGRILDLSTAWPDTPLGFQRQFQSFWQHAPKLYPDLSLWNLTDLLIGKRRLSEDDFVQSLEFQELQQHRIIGLPLLLTKADVGPVLDSLKCQLLEKLPDTRELLGTPRCWKVFVSVEQFTPPGANSRTQAVSDYLRSNIAASRFTAAEFTIADQRRWLRDGRLVPPVESASGSEWDEFKRAKKRYNAAYKAEQSCSRHVPRWVAFIDTLVGATFPVMNVELLLKPTPS